MNKSNFLSYFFQMNLLIFPGKFTNEFIKLFKKVINFDQGFSLY